MSDTSWPNEGGSPINVFNHKLRYDDMTVTYNSLGDPSLVIYFRDGVEVARVVIEYSINSFPVFNGDELRDHKYNIFTGIFEYIAPFKDSPSSHTMAELDTIKLLGLSTDNMLTSNNEYDIITDNSGEIIFSPTTS